MKILLVLAVAAVVMIILWRYRKRSRKRKKSSSSLMLPSSFAVSPAPLLAEDEVALYNLLRMVVQDRYLVFAQVPLCSFISADAIGKERSQLLRHLVLKRVDFVLVHPGSCQVEQVVQIEHQSPDLRQVESQQIIESVLEAAGIKLMKLQAKRSYPLAQLATRLEITADS